MMMNISHILLQQSTWDEKKRNQRRKSLDQSMSMDKRRYEIDFKRTINRDLVRLIVVEEDCNKVNLFKYFSLFVEPS